MARRRVAPAPVVFLDAGFFIGLIKDDDPLHAASLRWGGRYADRPQLTTTPALAEACDKYPSHDRWRRFHAVFTKLRADPLVTIEPVGEELLDRAAALRQKNLARKWGLADCVSFTVMRDYGITDALAADKHFNEAGFDALLLRR